MDQPNAPRDSLVRHAPFTQRDTEGDGLNLVGHGAVFNQWTTIDSWEGRFQERIAPGAFKKTLRESASRVRLQFDHGQHPLIGSLPIGAIRELREDETGLYVDARLMDNWLVQPVRDAIESGAIDGMSFRFSVEKEKWEKLDTDMPERTITEVRLIEVGPVVWPAYAGTDVGVRSLELARSLAAVPQDARADLARALVAITADETEPPDTPDPEAAERTSEPEAVSSTEPQDADPPAEHSGTYKPAVRPTRSSEDRAADIAYLRSLTASA